MACGHSEWARHPIPILAAIIDCVALTSLFRISRVAVLHTSRRPCCAYMCNCCTAAAFHGISWLLSTSSRTPGLAHHCTAATFHSISWLSSTSSRTPGLVFHCTAPLQPFTWHIIALLQPFTASHGCSAPALGPQFWHIITLHCCSLSRHLTTF
eukprot:scaffold31351_cov18-Tisochrysis_lutea.AAC.1